MKYLYLILVSLVGILLIPTSVYADNCHRVSSYTPTYHAPTYYETNHVIAIPVAIIPSTFYQVSPELVYAAILKEAVSQAAAIGARSALAELSKAQPTPGPIDPAASIKAIPAASTGQPLTPKDKGATNPVEFTQTVINNNCLKCHNSENPKANFTDITKLDEVMRSRIVLRTMTDGPLKMPPGKSQPIKPEELDALHNFAMSTSVK